MSERRDNITKFCREYLKVKDFQDYCHNGLQIEGKDQVGKIVAGVSFNKELIEAAIEKKADMLVVHHGIFGDQIDKPPVIKGVVRNRVKLLLNRDISLLGFHLPLDAHAKIGNNISLCRLLGVRGAKPVDVGYVGELLRPMEFGQFVKFVEKSLQTRAYCLPAGPKMVKRVGIISGGASPSFEKVKEAGADTYISGDIRESTYWAIKEAGMNYINAGHYNTEKWGVQNLGKLLAKKFKVKVEFIDTPCEI